MMRKPGITRLTGQQQAFLEAYLKNDMKSASDAYRIAYPTSNKWNAAAVSHEASTLLLHPIISVLVEGARVKAAERLVKVAEEFVITRERISRELAAMAFVDARKLFTWGPDGVTIKDSEALDDASAAAVVEVSQTITPAGGTIKVKLADKRAALVDLARLHGFVVDKGPEVNVLVSLQAAETRAQLIARLEAMAKPEPLTIEGEATSETGGGKGR